MPHHQGDILRSKAAGKNIGMISAKSDTAGVGSGLVGTSNVPALVMMVPPTAKLALSP